ncbi:MULTISPECIES: ABC transporter substrate-binding protein [unclassified Parafrankia]|uniref:ABC transporter substrate-binding protein n=1 Tax=unclassified Parafrankia TaxID=2994368 RepID=UPI000DA52F8E|nr:MULTISPECIES: ABC transporter substrate-binding protein [unclassified Parafrankia]TCJ33320.1 ABC transporter substrate-binding protein [Parafrankia sp. BMG5.11]SQD93505.1 Extracellular solute-binding protein family 5 [Parafrankia sp. Ea1.12]
MKRRLRSPRPGLIATALAVTAALGLSACGSSGDDGASNDTAGAPVAGGTLKVAFFPDNPAFNCLDPFQTYWIEHRTVIRNVADSLTDQDPKTGEIKPWLAEKWEISADGKEYTFHLRDGVTFSDGTPLDAAAVKANFDGAKSVVEETGGATYGASYILGYDRSEVVDPSTVKLFFSTPNASFLQATSTTNLAIISPASYKKTIKERCLGDYVASGAFTLEGYKPNELTTLKRRPGYAWGSALSENTGEAHLDTVEFSYVAEDSVRTGNLLSGAVDIAWPRNPFTVEDRELIEKSGDVVESRPLPGPASTFYANVSAGRPLADLNVRKALYKAFDLESYARTVFGADYPVVEGAFDTTTPYFVSQADKLRHDPEGAGKLLDQAGWKLGPDGYRHKGDQKLTLSTPTTQFNVGSELIQDQLKQVGIDLVLDTTTTAELPAKLKNGDYDLTATYFTRADPGALQFILNPEIANSKALATNATTPEVQAKLKELFARAAQTTDAEQSKQAYADLQNLLIDEGVSFPQFERVQFAGVSNEVHGFAFTSESFLKLNDVWKQQ